MKILQNYIEYWLLLSIRVLVSVVSLRFALVFGDLLGLFTFYIIRIRRKVAIDNLHRAFPEKSLAECKKIIKRTYCNFSKMAVEYLRFHKLNSAEIQRRVHFDNAELFKDAVALNKGVICVGGHFGNWEIMAAAIRNLGYPMVVIAADQRNTFVTNLFNRNRNHVKIEVVGRGIAIRGIMKALHQRKFVAILADQDAHKEGVFVEFLGRPASTAQGPAALALKTGAPLIMGTCIREKAGNHRVILEHIETDGFSDFSQDNIFAVTQKYSRILEHYITQYPDHWFL